MAVADQTCFRKSLNNIFLRLSGEEMRFEDSCIPVRCIYINIFTVVVNKKKNNNFKKKKIQKKNCRGKYG